MALAIVLISAEPGKDRKVANELKKLKAVERVFLVSGLYDVVARVQGASPEEILALVYDKVRPIAGLKSSHTMFALEVRKERRPVLSSPRSSLFSDEREAWPTLGSWI